MLTINKIREQPWLNGYCGNLIWSCGVCRCTMCNKWELCSPISLELWQLHLCSTCVLSGGKCSVVIQFSRSLVFLNLCVKQRLSSFDCNSFYYLLVWLVGCTAPWDQSLQFQIWICTLQALGSNPIKVISCDKKSISHDCFCVL